jgi:hypothetical protein
VGRTHVACGDLVDVYVLQEVVLARVDGAIALLDGDGTTVWSSTVDLDPPFAIDAAGVAVSELGIALAPAGAGGDRPIVVLDRYSLGPQTWSDPAPDVAAIGVSAAP